MPRAFLITRRRFDGEIEETAREYSPERVVRLGEYGCGQQATSDGASECGSESSTSDCPEELYNLTKLAEVSLAAAAGTLYHPQQSVAERSRALFFERIESERESLVELKTRRPEQPQALRQPDAFDVQFKTDLPDPLELPAPPPLSLAPQQPAERAHEQHSPQAQVGQGQAEGGEEHECPDCGKRYSTSSNLARHRQTHRSLGDKKARRCPHCDKVYVSIPAFSMHVRTHNQGCKCHYCGKCFSRPWLLQGHIRTHTGEKPFKCTICNKAFADKSNLRAHIQTHSNTKPHVCSRCGKAFALKSYLYKHEESSCMRSHQQQQQPARERRESSTSPRLSPPQQQQQQPATPTSVIVRPPELSRMVIRTSVISPNPEHLARFAEKQQQMQAQPQPSRQPFDFNDPTRVSAFSRPQSMTLNLAIA